MTMKQTLLLASLLLAGCAEPMINDSDVIRRASDPAFAHGDRGIVPVSCQGDRSSYSARPSGCARDLAFAAQVANPADLVDPVRPGPGLAGPMGRAADAYINPGPRGTINNTPSSSGRGAEARRIYPQEAVPSDPYGG